MSKKGFLSLKKKLKELLQKKQKYDHEYYVLSNPTVTDYEYDKLRSEIDIIEKKLQEIDPTSSQMSFIGFDSDQNFQISKKNEFKKIPHEKPVLSLDNTYSIKDVEDFISKIYNFSLEKNVIFSVEPKIDGVSFSAKYESGKLIHILTRGDGLIGEDVTNNVSPLIKDEIDCKNCITVRGEIFMKKSYFDYNLENNPNFKFSNPRNATSGLVRRLERIDPKSEGLECVAYQLIGIEKSKHSESISFLHELGFKTTYSCIKKCSNISEIKNYIEEINLKKHEFKYDIDGLVIKVDDVKLQNRLGYTAKYPRWSVAYKLSAVEAYTKLKGVTWQVGRTGNVTPVANLKPISLGGVVIQKATLHNTNEVKKLNIFKNCIVKIKRSGDVIPYIIEVKNDSNLCDSKEFIKIPTTCPCCESNLEYEGDSNKILRCQNYQKCKDQIVQRLSHFCSKKCLNFNGLSIKNISKMLNLKIISPKLHSIFDIKNHKDVFVENEGWGELMFHNITFEIMSFKEIDLDKFLYSLGIRHIGEAQSKMIANYFLNIENIVNLHKNKNFDNALEDICKINSLGEKIALSFLNYFYNEENIEDVLQIMKYIKIKPSVKNENGQSILFTGKLDGMSRHEAKEIAKNMGYNILSGVSKNLNILVAGSGDTSKVKKAKELGIKIVDEKEWECICKNDQS